MAEAMAEKGYAATSVGDVLNRAGVSRRAFYQVFGSKLDCFLAAFDGARDILIERIREGAMAASADRAGETGQAGGIGRAGAANDPVGRFEAAITAYLSALAGELAFARLFLVESYAAGPEAVKRRIAAQEPIAESMARVLGVTGPAGRFTCATVIAAVGSMVTGLVATGDADGIRALGPALTEHVRRLWQMGAFDEPR
ncbi:MAG: TetR/AcrR family transcriptional regulator [Nocardiopsaceae bacterium]|nr:TetR/AcrR family transcriptional regulator [Nocardiopsaceae bacterium]